LKTYRRHRCTLQKKKNFRRRNKPIRVTWNRCMWMYVCDKSSIYVPINWHPVRDKIRTVATGQPKSWDQFRFQKLEICLDLYLHYWWSHSFITNLNDVIVLCLFSQNMYKWDNTTSLKTNRVDFYRNTVFNYILHVRQK